MYMYHSIVRQQIRRAFQRLNQGDYEAVLRQFDPNIEFFFAGSHALGGERQSREAVRAWFEEFYRRLPGLSFEVHRVLVNGWPWDTRVATHFAIRAPLTEGRLYENSGVQWLRLRWGRAIEDRIYEDSQKLALELQRLPAHEAN